MVEKTDKKIKLNIFDKFKKLIKPDSTAKKLIYGIIIFLVLFHAWLHFSNPYASGTFFKNPYSTQTINGEIVYRQDYKQHIDSNEVANWLGYYKSGYLIVENTLFGGKPIKSSDDAEIIAEIHRQRFDPTKPYLISGDQFSVLYPRNLGVFYNQLLDPNTALDQTDWQNRQQIYLQSALYAIDGLSASEQPRTTVIPITPKSSVLTQVHPGGVGSDSVFGILYAIDKLSTQNYSDDHKYYIQTTLAAKQLLAERQGQLKYMVKNYIDTVQDPDTKLVKSNLHLSSARDGVIRQSSFYDNVVLWKTIELAKKYNLYDVDDQSVAQLQDKIKYTFWNENKGIYNNDITDQSFSSDWLIGYYSGFFDLADKDDLSRSEKIVDYIRANHIAEPLPIKYQDGGKIKAPFFVGKFAGNYGSNTIWSYWGNEYITLLANLYNQTKDKSYLDEAQKGLDAYKAKIIKYGGFPETFDEQGNIFRSGIYKSILITGWVVQYEHAGYLVRQFSQTQANPVSY